MKQKNILLISLFFLIPFAMIAEAGKSIGSGTFVIAFGLIGLYLLNVISVFVLAFKRQKPSLFWPMLNLLWLLFALGSTIYCLFFDPFDVDTRVLFGVITSGFSLTGLLLYKRKLWKKGL